MKRLEALQAPDTHVVKLGLGVGVSRPPFKLDSQGHSVSQCHQMQDGNENFRTGAQGFMSKEGRHEAGPVGTPLPLVPLL